MEETNIQQLDELVKRNLELEFEMEEEDIQRSKDFNVRDENRQRELLKASGFDLNKIDQFEAEDVDQAESEIIALNDQFNQIQLFDEPEFQVADYQDMIAEEFIQSQRAEIGPSTVDPWRRLGPASHSCGNDRKTHNEGGKTWGVSECQHVAGRSLMQLDARGDGSGISDDNDVHLWSWHWYFWRPRHYGHVLIHPYAQYHGYVYNRANDKWYNSKDTASTVRLRCEVWQDRGSSSTAWKRLGDRSWSSYHLSSQNVNKTRRFNHEVRYGNYGNQVVWANKLVAIRVENYISGRTEGSGSYAIADFRNSGRYIRNWVNYQFSW